MIVSSVLNNNTILLWHVSCLYLYMNTKILKKYFNEMYAGDGEVRKIYELYSSWLKELPDGKLERRNAEAELLFRRLGITFAVYGETDDVERLIPFDIVPRIFGAAE